MLSSLADVPRRYRRDMAAWLGMATVPMAMGAGHKLDTQRRQACDEDALDGSQSCTDSPGKQAECRAARLLPSHCPIL
jgi:hypothetical protein